MNANYGKWPLLFLLALAFSACAGEMQGVERSILERDQRNENVDFSLRSKGDMLEYCVNDISPQASALDVFRVLLHAADELQQQKFEAINLCFRDEVKFILPGEHFAVIGEEFEFQNPTYTIRTFPEKLKLPGGGDAYETHRGGLLYLARVQMEDFEDMTGKWFMKELADEYLAEKDAKRPKEFVPDEEAF